MRLFAYQTSGAEWLAERKRALLCDEMGLGKTAQAVTAAQQVGATKVLVLCPAAVVANWKREWRMWAPGAPEPTVLSYDMARRPSTLNHLRVQAWDVMIADEAHYLKNRTAARTVAAKALAASSTHAWGLTGTPMPNTADELWSLLAMFGPAALDKGDGTALSYSGFRGRFCQEVPLGKTGMFKIVGVKNAAELKSRMAPVLLRRKKLEVLKDLPPLREGEIALSAEGYAKELDHTEAGEAGALIRELLAMWLVSDEIDRLAAKMLDNASDESVSRLRRLTATIKARALAPVLVEELGQTEEKLVVMGWHRETLDVLHEALEPFGVVRLDGQTPARDRQAVVDAFQTEPGTRVFLGQIAAAGTGITLTAAANLVFAELSWTPSDNAQAAMRIHRVGQTRPVLVRYATLADTIDEVVVSTLRRKSAAISAVLN